MDIGISHIALSVSDLEASVAFYNRYARMRKIHERPGVAWLADGSRPFVVVLIRVEGPIMPLVPENHIGVAVESQEEVDRLANRAKEEGCLIGGPQYSGPIVGYWCYVRDPAGHTLEISYGQEVGLAVQRVLPLSNVGRADVSV